MLYGRNYFVAFLDSFRLKCYYDDIFKLCEESECDRILSEILMLERVSYSEYSGGTRPKLSTVIRNSLSFFVPTTSLMLDSFSYLASEMAYCRYKTSHCFLAADYKAKVITVFMKTHRYKVFYDAHANARDIVPNAVFDLAYAAGNTEYKSSSLTARITKETIVTL